MLKNEYGWLTKIFFVRDGDRSAFFFVFIFVWRRLIFAGVTALMPEWYSTQVMVFCGCCLIMMICLIKYAPFGPRDPFLNNVAFINEVFLFIGGVMMLPMSNLVKDIDSRWTVGKVMIALVSLCIIFNLIILSIIAVELWRKFRAFRRGELQAMRLAKEAEENKASEDDKNLVDSKKESQGTEVEMATLPSGRTTERALITKRGEDHGGDLS